MISDDDDVLKFQNRTQFQVQMVFSIHSADSEKN
jgi:hypothetical protein